MSTQSLVSAQTSLAEQSPAHKVECYVQEHLKRYLHELSDLCAIDSGTAYKAGVDEVALYLAGRMRGLDMDVNLFENEKWGNDVYGVLKGTGKGIIVLLGHMDTVYPIGTAAARPLRVENNKIYGPGVIDMKGCILSAIYALEALQSINYHDFAEIRFLCVSDEEISDRHSKEIIRQVCNGCHAALVLEAARENGDLVSARKGGAWYKLRAYGHSAHAGVEPEKGSNAILELAHQVVKLQALNGWREGLTINTGRIHGGTATNVVPDFAEAFIDIRFARTEDRVALEQHWNELLQQHLIPGVELSIEIDPDDRDPMACTPENLHMARRAQEIAQELGFEVRHAPTGGISDANYASGFGYPALDGLGPVGGLDHSPDEYMELDSVAPRTALLAGLIASIGTRAE
ncbi:M20 family metallopeptidase [Dictyobacter kobayashii]|uniref:Glutamate carboxypeptidase n=1 Tax=Dictyobacter kobayashii TaxID=2014872 RepID=A0A402AJG0_9CHLR|nr:M20 family metallopeptidase [Dictyobacter kobayashii]GCE19204.1 glutamate carboxypeptidase [Dictyobacter kobayashii]